LELFKAEILEVEFELLTMRNGNSGFGWKWSFTEQSSWPNKDIWCQIVLYSW
jgi:hypothetical protein